MAATAPTPSLIRELPSLPEDVPAAVAQLLSVASTYHNTGYYDEALDTYENALESWPGADGPHKEAEVYVRLCTGAVYQSLGEDDTALEQFDRSVQMARDPEQKAASLSCSAAIRFYAKQYKEALSLFQEAFSIRCRTFRNKVPRDAEIIDEDDVRVVRKMMEGHAMEQERFFATPRFASGTNGGADDSSLQQSLAMRNFLESLQEFSNEITEELVEAYRLWTGLSTVYNNIGACLFCLGEVKPAIQCYQVSYGLLKAQLGADHPRSTVIQRNLDQARRFQLKNFRFAPVEIKPIALPKGVVLTATSGAGGKAGGKAKGKKGGKKSGKKKK